MLEAQQLAVPMLATVNDVLRAKGLMLRRGTVLDATLISAQSSTKIGSCHCDPKKPQ